MPSPFAQGVPHPIAVRAAEALVADLRRGDPLPSTAFRGEDAKMFGVLVVADAAGQIGYLKAFSGMLEGSWRRDGFVPPVFDEQARDAFWPRGEAELVAMDAELEALKRGPLASARAALHACEVAQRDARATIEASLAARRHHRHGRRDALIGQGLSAEAVDAALQVLAQESRADTAELRRLRAAHRVERDAIEQELKACERRRVEIERRRASRSCELLEQLFAGYQIPNARGLQLPVRALFAPHTPPGGTGDCAAPKLFNYALRSGLRPIALAELWWGTAPPGGGRRAGNFYPACRGKCGPVLAHMLDGLAVDPTPVFGAGGLAPEEPRVVFEDRWIVIVDKPIGLLSVPGRSGLQDSVLLRLRARHPDATGPLLVHRLDLDTSGLLMAAKDASTHAALAAQFFRREIDKRYVAVLDGAVAGDRGAIELPLRVDLDDRPRQIVDPTHGKPARTEWQVLSREGGQTRVALWPRTGRTHQLRVHAAHPQGLGAPIVGDPLYGAPDERLMLHAEALTFIHPHTAARVVLERPAPF